VYYYILTRMKTQEITMKLVVLIGLFILSVTTPFLHTHEPDFKDHLIVRLMLLKLFYILSAWHSLCYFCAPCTYERYRFNTCSSTFPTVHLLALPQ